MLGFPERACVAVVHSTASIANANAVRVVIVVVVRALSRDSEKFFRFVRSGCSVCKTTNLSLLRFLQS